MIVTTTSTIDNYEIVEYLGVVAGEAVMGINMFRDMGAGLRNMFGGRSAGYEEEMQEARETVLAEMQERAEAMGANAVVGASLGYETFEGMIMTVASGTAVRIRRRYCPCPSEHRPRIHKAFVCSPGPTIGRATPSSPSN